MMSINKSVEYTENELPDIQERYEFDSEDEDEASVEEIPTCLYPWRNKRLIDTANKYDKDFPPLPTMKNNLPTHINIHNPYHQ